MWPRSRKAADRGRAQLRDREVRLVMERLRSRLPARGENALAPPRILEFGSGEGHQIPWLRALGTVVASDVYVNPELQHEKLGADYVVCDIARSPFADDSFDIIYSNHVLEHVPDLDGALEEIQRIGRPGCLYVFSLPTPLWLLLSVPVRYWDRIQRVWTTALRLLGRKARSSPGEPRAGLERPPAATQHRSRLAAWLLPGGHGEYPGFWEAFRVFRLRAWRSRFARHDLAEVEHRLLLLYSPVRWPFVPVNELGARFGLASSRLFILRSQRACVPQQPQPQTA